ncbi:hypothetical protein ACR77J_07475 [Tissierella praeacuta]|uniref:hypothetical protein n=1 Tax=Tissierella praeacuta TaxID=43131 RepID=UPI003DA2ED09
MNNNTNDQRILKLKEQIAEKKSLNKTLRFSPITNCSIEVDGIRYNIQVLNREDLISLMVKLNSYMMSAKELDMLDEYLISGYKVEDWITDIKSRIEIISSKDEERKLKAMEEKLLKLLSDGKKVELEIDEIESILKN